MQLFQLHTRFNAGVIREVELLLIELNTGRFLI